MSGIRSRIVMAAAVLGTSLFAAPAFAEVVQLQAHLDGANVVPPVTPAASTSTGEFTATLDTETRVLNWKLEFEPLLGQFTGAHFHGKATPDHPNQNNPALLPLRGSGRESPIEGTATLAPWQVEALLAGDWSVNVKTSTFAKGQMAGNVTRVSQ